MTDTTRAELLSMCEAAYKAHVNGKATKADLTALLTRLSDSLMPSLAESEHMHGAVRTGDMGGAVHRVEIVDARRGVTVLDLDALTVESPSARRTYVDGLTVAGQGSVLRIDMENLKLYDDGSLEWDPAPDSLPVAITFGPGDAPAGDAPAGDAPAAEYPNPFGPPTPEEEPAP